jgi:hypothetical protein
MREGLRLYALLAVTYLTASQVIQILWTAAPELSARVAANALIVPAAQLAALAAMARLRRVPLPRYGDAFGLGGFFAAWAVALVALGAATAGANFGLFRTVDLTAAMAATLLFVPVVQAAAFSAATASGRWPRPDWRRLLTHPLAGPVLWIDALMLPAGWLLPTHPLFGLADAAIMQRRWMGTKCIAAACALAVVAIRSRPDRRASAFAAAALVLGAIGLDGFTQWMFASAMKMPEPIAVQPLYVIWLEVFGVLAALFAAVNLRLIRVIEPESAGPAFLLRAGSLLMFLALLSLLMNGFLSWQPVQPWAGMAMTSGSLSASTFAMAALMLVSPEREAAVSARI